MFGMSHEKCDPYDNPFDSGDGGRFIEDAILDDLACERVIISGSSSKRKLSASSAESATKSRKLSAVFVGLQPESQLASEPAQIKQEPAAKATTTAERRTFPNVQEPSRISRRSNWSHVEEVFLVGAVMERFFRAGSLTSKSNKGEDGDSNECWADIKGIYDFAWRVHSDRSNTRAPMERSANTLSRHYKVMKSKLSDLRTSGGKNFRDYYNEFQEIYDFRAISLASAGGSTSTPPN